MKTAATILLATCAVVLSDPGWRIGVQCKPAPSDEPKGVVIIDVLTPSPGSEAGLRVGDIITKAGNSRVTDGRGLDEALDAQAVLQLTVARAVDDERRHWKWLKPEVKPTAVVEAADINSLFQAKRVKAQKDADDAQREAALSRILRVTLEIEYNEFEKRTSAHTDIFDLPKTKGRGVFSALLSVQHPGNTDVANRRKAKTFLVVNSESSDWLYLEYKGARRAMFIIDGGEPIQVECVDYDSEVKFSSLPCRERLIYVVQADLMDRIIHAAEVRMQIGQAQFSFDTETDLRFARIKAYLDDVRSKPSAVEPEIKSAKKTPDKPTPRLSDAERGIISQPPTRDAQGSGGFKLR